MPISQMPYRRNIRYNLELPKSIIVWILKNVRVPIQGYEHKTRQGKQISLTEQVSETQYQLLLIANYYYKQGMSEEGIYEVLSPFLHKSL